MQRLAVTRISIGVITELIDIKVFVILQVLVDGLNEAMDVWVEQLM